jgi:ABC-type bacteriocin/lantibiotic exporter with double-glycine peptidase domain
LKILLFLSAATLFLIAPVVSAEEIRGVPFVKQDRLKCGPASLASVLSFYGISIPVERISQAVYSDKLKGSLITDLESFSRQYGFKSQSGQGSIEILKKFIERKQPAIVLVDMGFWVASTPHYLVVVGYTEEGIIVHDGETPSRNIAVKNFEKSWRKMGCPYLVIYP